MAKSHATRKSAAHQTTTTSTRNADAGKPSVQRTGRKETGGGGVSVKPNERTIYEDDEPNSGFGGYLSSGSGQAMIKLFVLCNTLLIVVTICWPHIRDSIYVIRNLLLD